MAVISPTLCLSSDVTLVVEVTRCSSEPLRSLLRSHILHLDLGKQTLTKQHPSDQSDCQLECFGKDTYNNSVFPNDIF